MKILVTGANGFTGRHFCHVAKHAGHDVITLRADLTKADAVTAEVSAIQPSAVVHLAAISFVGHADNTAFYAVNVVGTTNLLSALAKLQQIPSKVLLASSANVYGNSKTSPISENHPPAPVNHYAASKLAMEHMARTYSEYLPIVLTRPFNYTGAGQAENFIIPKLINHFVHRAESIELGNLNVEREFNDVRMVVSAYLKLLEHAESQGVYNICSGQPYTLQHVIDTLSELTEHRIRIQINPKFVRTNEVHRLCGNPNRIVTLLKNSRSYIPAPTLQETLSWMLKEATI
jgi:nucleoside-diphosphate-sugar epimerase